MAKRLFLASIRSAALAAAMASACGGDNCPIGQTSLELSIGVADPDVRARVQTLWVELTIGGQRARKLFNPGSKLDQGRFEIDVILDTSIGSNGGLNVMVTAHDNTGGSGKPIAESAADLTISQDTCNRAKLDLEPNDGALPMDDPPAPAPTSPTSPSPSNPMMSPPPRNCSTTADSGTIALFSFEESLSDTFLANQLQSDQIDGRLVGSGFSPVPGPTGCGNAIEFPASAGSSAYVLIPDRRRRGRNVFSLSEGSIDLSVRAPGGAPYSSRLTVAARDTAGLDTGIALMIACDGTLVARIGRIDGTQFHQCSDAPIGADAWHRVAVNFGPPGFELLVDGVRQTRTGSVGLGQSGCTELVACGTSTTTGMDVGTSPWVLGIDAVGADPSTLSPLQQPFLQGAVDEVRISSVRR
jgi:hypothetical protein